jgi:hypothetical protein
VGGGGEGKGAGSNNNLCSGCLHQAAKTAILFYSVKHEECDIFLLALSMDTVNSSSTNPHIPYLGLF